MVWRGDRGPWKLRTATDKLIHRLLKSYAWVRTGISGAHPLAQLALGRFLYEVQCQQGQNNECYIADPRIEQREAEPVKHMAAVYQVP